MKLFNNLTFAFLSASLVANAVVADDHDHDHDHELEHCADLNVTDAVSCGDWCGPDMVSEWTYVTEHGDFEDLHIDFLSGWECHCEPSDETAIARSAVEHMDCLLPYELPTCQSKGLADCGDNATMTCGELCDSVGLGLGGSTTASRMLDQVTDVHYCAHHEGDDHDHDHDHGRFLDEDGDHDHEEGVTICYCNADQEAATGSTAACSDVDLLEHDDHDDDDSAAVRTKLFAGLLLLAANALSFLA